MFNSLVFIILSINLVIISLIYLKILYFIIFRVSIIDVPSFVSILIISHMEIFVERYLSFTYVKTIKKHGDLESSFRYSGIFLFIRMRTMHLFFLIVCYTLGITRCVNSFLCLIKLLAHH